jgi:hypothetical protein
MTSHDRWWDLIDNEDTNGNTERCRLRKIAVDGYKGYRNTQCDQGLKLILAQAFSGVLFR